eukprot:CAMPEP_0172513064 /NCGR_PEP_ID=MMETSP1066-20121228/249410_1 /TAXON_ID=671091 /ORGANISM="Coscinodiscus wailesii, Strain CCMP2513" /LENGTH=502 /DNA_ID=CAMNT_0013293151 /DNA_START=112 /DNA_END=1620 /DNA_ORIENTATION=-
MKEQYKKTNEVADDDDEDDEGTRKLLFKFLPSSSFPCHSDNDNTNLLKTILIFLYCHFSVTLLCFNVAFDLFALGLPILILSKTTPFLNSAALTHAMTHLINYTTPIVFSMPLLFSGTKIYCNDIDLLLKSKSQNSLLLANHGSRIDWMVGMFCGYLSQTPPSSSSTSPKRQNCERTRVGFVCEHIIALMPLVGWYRKLVCDDIFVKRSFANDRRAIRDNIRRFRSARAKRMLFLSPEGVVADFGRSDEAYVDACRKFCVSCGYDPPFEYVLTPRYKGTTCLVDHVDDGAGEGGGLVVSVCMAFVRGGKLLNTKLTSPDRVIPDIYLLNRGIGGRPVDIYIHLVQMDMTCHSDAKRLLMDDYRRKDNLLAEWERVLIMTTTTNDEKDDRAAKKKKDWFDQYTLLETNYWDAVSSHALHAALIVATARFLGRLDLLARYFSILFWIVTTCHTVGWMAQSTSRESVPFETGIKAFVAFFMAGRGEDAVRNTYGNTAKSDDVKER